MKYIYLIADLTVIRQNSANYYFIADNIVIRQTINIKYYFFPMGKHLIIIHYIII